MSDKQTRGLDAPQQSVGSNWRQVAERRHNGKWVKSPRTKSGEPVFPRRESGTEGMNFTRAPGE